MSWWQRIVVVLACYVCVLLFVNVAFWVLVDLQFPGVVDAYEDGFIFDVGDTAYVFAHGYYGLDCPDGWLGVASLLNLSYEEYIEQCAVEHVSRFGDETMSTLVLVESLRNQGYERVWGSWCEAGDEEWVRMSAPDAQGHSEMIPWPEYVIRNERPGRTVPVFWGLGFFFLSI